MAHTSFVSSPDSYETYVWGSNSSGQLTEGCQEKVTSARRSKAFSGYAEVNKSITRWKFNFLSQLEAGQYCTFAVSSRGDVSACGKGSYGRLGLGDSGSQTQLKLITTFGLNDVIVSLVSSSKGSDGHSMAITSTGQVYSWGDGKEIIISYI